MNGVDTVRALGSLMKPSMPFRAPTPQPGLRQIADPGEPTGDLRHAYRSVVTGQAAAFLTAVQAGP